MGIELRVRLVEPASQSNPARHRIDFGNDIAFVGKNEVGPNHPRQIVADFFAPGKFDQLLRFAGVEVTCHPLGLLSLDAQLIKLIAGPLEYKKPMAQLLELFEQFARDRKRIWRKKPVFLSEKTLFGESCADNVPTIFCCCDHCLSTSDVRGSTSNFQLAVRVVWIEGFYLPAAIFFRASFTSSSADLASPVSCNARTALCASICL